MADDLPDDLPPLVGEDGVELPPDQDDVGLPPLVGEDGREVPLQDDGAPPRPPDAVGQPAAAATAAVRSSQAAGGVAPPPATAEVADGAEEQTRLPAGVSEAEAAKATAALQAVVALQAAAAKQAAPEHDQEPEAEQLSADAALKAAMAVAEEPKKPFQEPDEKTMRMVKAITKDDFEECEDAIMQGADVNADCGAGMKAIHMSALRGEMFLTELLLAHGAGVNTRDMSGNTPLLYACHFYRQHGKGVQLVSQLLHHRADPNYQVKDGKMKGQTAQDIMDKACSEPNTDESVPRQMRAMLQLASDGKDENWEAISKMWMHYKVQNKKLFQVSSKKDRFDYAMKTVDWETPEGAKNAQANEPVRLEENAGSILGERFTDLQNYLFTDEGEKVKVYVTIPEAATGALSDAGALKVDFDYQAFDLKLRTASDHYRLKVEPLFGSIEVGQCKHRVSTGSSKVTLTLVKRFPNRKWTAIQKQR